MAMTRKNANRTPRLVCWARSLARVLERTRRAVWHAIEEDAIRSTQRADGSSRDLFDELPDPPHLEYGEVRYRNGRFNYLDG